MNKHPFFTPKEYVLNQMPGQNRSTTVSQNKTVTPFYNSSTEESELVIRLRKTVSEQTQPYSNLKTMLCLAFIGGAGCTGIPLVLNSAMEYAKDKHLIFTILGIPSTVFFNTVPFYYTAYITWINFETIFQSSDSIRNKIKEGAIAIVVSTAVTIPTLGIVIKETQETEGIMKFFVPTSLLIEWLGNTWSFFEIRERLRRFNQNVWQPLKVKYSKDAENWKDTYFVKTEFIKQLEKAKQYLINTQELVLKENFGEDFQLFDKNKLLGNNKKNEFYNTVSRWMEMGEKWKASGLDLSRLPPGQHFFLQWSFILKILYGGFSLLYLNSTVCEAAVSFTDVFQKIATNIWNGASGLSWLYEGLGWSITILTMLPQIGTSLIYALVPFELLHIFAAWLQDRKADLPSVWRKHPILMTSLTLFFTPPGMFSFLQNDKFTESCGYNPLWWRIISDVGNTKLIMLYFYFTIIAIINLYDQKYGADFSKHCDEMCELIEKTLETIIAMPLSDFATEITSTFAAPVVEQCKEIKDKIEGVKEESERNTIAKGEEGNFIREKPKKNWCDCFSGCWPFTWFATPRQNKHSLDKDLSTVHIQKI